MVEDATYPGFSLRSMGQHIKRNERGNSELAGTAECFGKRWGMHACFSRLTALHLLLLLKSTVL